MDNVRPVVAFNSVEEFWGCAPFSFAHFLLTGILTSIFPPPCVFQSLQQHCAGLAASQKG